MLVCNFRTNGCWFSDISGIDEGESQYIRGFVTRN
jgi:hypothetical protein